MEYTFKRGYAPDMDRIEGILKEVFSSGFTRNGERCTLSDGALKSCQIWIEKKKLNVITESLLGAPDDVIMDTNRRFRKFLEKATGYTAKQRVQMAKKEVQGE
jgi:hypothetical protein